MVQYENIAPVILQCDQKMSTAKQRPNTFSGNAANACGRRTNRYNPKNKNDHHRQSNCRLSANGNSNNRTKKRLNPEELRDHKLKCRCYKCNKCGHWAVDHNTDGTIRDGLPSKDNPPKVQSGTNDALDNISKN